MRSPHLSTTTESDAAIFRPELRVPLTMHSGRRTPRAPVTAVRPAVDPSPLHSLQAFAAAMFVASMAACWIAVASTATAPLIAAGGMLGRAARIPEKQV